MELEDIHSRLSFAVLHTLDLRSGQIRWKRAKVGCQAMGEACGIY